MDSHAVPLSDRSTAIILGSLLGDGSLQIHEPYRNARFSFRNSHKQEEYFSWKVRALDEISGEQCVWKQGNDGKDGWGGLKLRYQSRALPSLTDIHVLTHKGGAFRIRRTWLNQLTPLSLAIWWCDDGSLIGNSRKGVFCTDRFSHNDVAILDRYMKKVWGITTSAGRVGNTEQYRLWIRSTEDMKKFLRIILPYLPVASMLPKVLLLYRDSELQQRWISEVVAATSFPRSVVENAVAAKNAKWKRFRE